MKKLLVVVLALAGLAGAQVYPGGTSKITPTTTTVSGLSAYQQTGRVVIVTDGTSTTDCATGGGSSRALCRWSGSVWQAVGGGAGGASIPTTSALLKGDGAGGASAVSGTGLAYLASGVPSVATPSEVQAEKLPTPAVGDGSTPDSTAINNSGTAGVTILLRGGATYIVSNLTLGNNVTLRCAAGAKLKMLASDTTNYMFNLTGTNQRIEGCIIDGNSVVKASGNKFLIFGSGATNLQIVNNTFTNTGSPSNTMGGILLYNSTATVEGNKMTDGTVTGVQLKVDQPSASKAVTIKGNILVGSADNGVYVTNSAGGYTPYSARMQVEVTGNIISNVADGFSLTGPKGNCIVVFQADQVNVHDNWCYNPRFSVVRVNSGFGNTIRGNHGYANGETAFYAELGAGGNLYEGNEVFNGVSGFNMTNLAERQAFSYDEPNLVVNNVVTNCAHYAIKVEHDYAYNNKIDGCSFGILVGFGASSHDNRVFGNTITRNNTAYPKPICGVCIDKSITTGTDRIYNNSVSGATASATVFPVSLPDGLAISAITQANPMVVTYTTVPSVTPATTQTYCFSFVSGMTQLRGVCAAPSAVNNGSKTMTFGGIDSTGYTAWSAPTGGQVNSMILLYTTGTTAQYSTPSSLVWDEYLAGASFGTPTVPGCFRLGDNTTPTPFYTGFCSPDTGAASYDMKWPATTPSAVSNVPIFAQVSGNISVASWLSTSGTGNFLRVTSPVMVTPTLGAATATSINKMAITAPATSSTLAVADGKTFTASNTLTITGTDGSSVNAGAGGTIVYTSNSYGFTVTFGNGGNWAPTANTNNYFGHYGLAGTTGAAVRRTYIPKAGTLKQIYGACQCGNSPSSETGSLIWRLNNTTDAVTINGSWAIAATATFNATGLSQAVSAGDYFELKYVTPASWATPPTTVICTGTAYFE